MKLSHLNLPSHFRELSKESKETLQSIEGEAKGLRQKSTSKGMKRSQGSVGSKRSKKRDDSSFYRAQKESFEQEKTRRNYEQ